MALGDHTIVLGISDMTNKVSSHFCSFLFEDPCWILVGYGKDTAVVLYDLYSLFLYFLDVGQGYILKMIQHLQVLDIGDPAQ